MHSTEPADILDFSGDADSPKSLYRAKLKLFDPSVLASIVKAWIGCLIWTVETAPSPEMTAPYWCDALLSHHDGTIPSFY